MKRKFSSKMDSSKLSKITPCCIWRSASTFSNYFRDEPLIDYLDKYRIYTVSDLSAHLGESRASSSRFRRRPPPSGMFAHLIEKGNIFESEVYYTLRDLVQSFYEFPNDVKEIFKDENYNKTLELLQNPDVDIIFHPVVRNYTTRTFGSPDLLLRGRFITALFENPPRVEDDFFYVVDIKASTLELDSSQTFLQNSILYDGYKSQLYIYSAALQEMTKNTANIAFVLGKGVRFGDKKVDSPYHTLGLIDYDTRDRWVVEKMPDAIDWLNRLEKDGDSWSLCPPSIPELCPNINNTCDKNYSNIKRILARRNGEITQLWQCGVEERRRAFRQGVTSLHDKRLTPEVLGIEKSSKKYNIVSRILEMRDVDYNYLIPIANNHQNWRVKTPEVYLDFETLYNSDDEIFVFLIGASYLGKHYTWLAQKCEKDEEKRIWKEFATWLHSLPSNTRIVHWGNIERHLLRTLSEKYDNITLRPGVIDASLDVLEVFRYSEDPIIVKDCYDFSLKTIAGALYRFGEIRDGYDGDVSDGATAMTLAINVYRHGLDIEEMVEVVTYNKKDCRIVAQILDFLRK